MKTVIVWETLPFISGGQKITLMVADLLKDSFRFVFLLPQKGSLSDELEKRGIKYYLLGDQSMPTGVKGLGVVPRYLRMSIKAICQAMWIIRAERPSMIYAPGPAALPWSAFCGSFCRIPVVWHLHHLFLDGPTKKLLNVCSGWRSVSRIICVSRFVADQLSNAKSDWKKTVIYNPVDVEKYASGDPSIILSEQEELKNVGEDTTIISMIGLLQEQKRQLFGIELVSELRRLNSGKCCLLLVGAGRDGDPYEDKLRTSVKRLGLEDSVVFLGYRSDVENILPVCDVVFIPSVEGLPLVGLEAIAAGIPVLANEEGGAGELVSELNWGATFSEADSISEVANKLLMAAQEKGKLKPVAVKDYASYREEIENCFALAVGKSNGR